MEYGNPIQINRNTFSRHDFMRRTIKADTIFEIQGFECNWCGREGKRTRSGRTLYQYGIWRDGLNTKPCFEDEMFCGKPCHDDYWS